MTEPDQTPKRRSCLFYGCITSLVLAAVVLVGLVFLVRNASNVLNRLAIQYTEPVPAQLQRVEVSPAELQQIEQRVARFGQALDQQVADELVLTDREINALIAQSPAFKEFRDKLFVTIDGNTVKGQISLPLDNWGPLQLKGRYLNAEVAFRVSFRNGQLGVFMDQLRVKGQSLPGSIATAFGQQNLAEQWQRDPQAAAQIARFESIQVQDGKLILRCKGR
jgi:hypothetical protein